ncbi:MAG: ATP-binding protein [Solirubrobacterales bacterium]
MLPAPRLRRVGRRLAAEAERLTLAFEAVRRAVSAPHGRIGRFLVRWRLRLKALLNPQLLFALAILVPVAVWRVVLRPSDGSVGAIVSSAVFGAVLIGAIAAFWLGVVRAPFTAWRIRRRIVKRPESVLPTTSPHRQAELMARDEELPIVPRDDLYDEILPGILDRRHSDIQMVVGEPGAGKTTALIGLAQRLARIGIVPVVVPIWGEMPTDLIETAEKRFKRLAGSLLGSNAHLDEVWRWLCAQRRVVLAIDDIDRIAPDGDRGFLLRRGLDELAGENLPAVVTSRPAGIPAGLAASAIDLDQLDQEAAVDHVLHVADSEPGAPAGGSQTDRVRGTVAQWVREGKFAEVPFYLELLARLVAVGRCEELSPASAVWGEGGNIGKARRKGDGGYEWNPQWVRFLLLERFYAEVAQGRVHRWLAIESRERSSCLTALSETALSTLAAVAMQARENAAREQGEKESGSKVRVRIEDFLESDDRAVFDGTKRRTVSAHEVVDTGERLRILDRDPSGKLHFHHRIMQAYLAGRCLAKRGAGPRRRDNQDWLEAKSPDWIGALLDPSHPERLTAQMTLTFAALRAADEEPSAGNRERPQSPQLVETVLESLVGQARRMLPGKVRTDGRKPAGASDADDARLDPRKRFHPEERRKDPDDALAKLATAAEIARATGTKGRFEEIVAGTRRANGATKWTKLQAIPSIAALDLPAAWHCMWEFARDPDQEVRRAASEAIADDALSAYRALESPIEALMERAARRSARGLPLDSPGRSAAVAGSHEAGNGRGRQDSYDEGWSESEDIPSLQALGWILPAIVSGLREYLDDPPSVDRLDAERVRSAREALEQFVMLAFQGGGHHELEASLAQGFKSDAMRHANAPDWRKGPGLVAHNRRFVTDFCIDNADYWYARLVLHQALALYTIAGSNLHVALDIYGRMPRRDREPHPFVWRAARLAKRAVARNSIGSDRWGALLWVDEGVAVSRRPAEMSRASTQLVADVTLLLNLRECAPEDRQAHFPHMRELPHCLSGSPDREEILGAGCPPSCGYGLCPLRQPPPDEPNGQRTVSRAFCRDQHEIADRHRPPPWQRKNIKRRDLREFWRQMERRART